MKSPGVSIMDNSNVPIGAIQKILGHENRSTTEIYLHSFDRAGRERFLFMRVRVQGKKSHTDKEKGITNFVTP